MVRRRNKTEILISILNACRSPQKPTRAMYATNMSWRPFKAALDELIEKGLMKEILVSKADKRTSYNYQTTQLGIDALEQYEGLAKVL